MKTRLLREIEETIRALQQFAVDWEQHFPESGEKTSRARSRARAGRLSEVLLTPQPLMVTGDVGTANRRQRSLRGRRQ